MKFEGNDLDRQFVAATGLTPWTPRLKGAELEASLISAATPPRNSLAFYPALLRVHRANMRAWWHKVLLSAAAVLALVAVMIALS